VNASLAEPSTGMLETRLAQLYKLAFRRLAQTEWLFAVATFFRITVKS
jgi:hypothetical protein